VAEPVAVAELVEATIIVGFSCGRFDASTNSATTGSTTTLTGSASAFDWLRWLSLSKPPPLLAFSVVISMLRQAQQPQAQRPLQQT